MIVSLLNRLRRSVMFICVNLVFAFFALSFLVVPLVSIYAERAERLAEGREQLTRIRSLQQRATVSGHSAADAATLLLPGNEEGSASAALQSDLKSIVAAAGAQFVTVRGLDSTRLADASIVTGNVEIKGSVHAIRDAVRGIEDHKPALMIESATFRGISAEQNGELHAEFTVQGLMQRTSLDRPGPRNRDVDRGR
jgi:hypothetical protein